MKVRKNSDKRGKNKLKKKKKNRLFHSVKLPVVSIFTVIASGIRRFMHHSAQNRDVVFSIFKLHVCTDLTQIGAEMAERLIY
jgi:hypothetical protein